jgi:hypothetical protein
LVEALGGAANEQSANIARVMDAAVTPVATAEVEPRLRCARCGIESHEPSCFVVPESSRPRPRDIRCITCEGHRLAVGPLKGAWLFVKSSGTPLLILALIQHDLHIVEPLTVIAVCLMSPIAMVLHEIGHAVCARLIGLEVSTVVIGVGRRLWRGTILGTCFTVHAWPVLGLTYLGAKDLHFLRTRLWLATLAGPLTNVLLVTATFMLVSPQTFFGSSLALLWMVVNLIMTLGTILPYTFKQGGTMLVSDGLALLQIPAKATEQLEPHLFTAPLMRAYALFEDGNFSSALAVCDKALERVPGNVHLRVMQSACRSYTLDFAGALETLEPLLKEFSLLPPSVRAAIENNTAFALLMSDARTDQNSEALLRADQLSSRVFALFPCVPAYRSTRALVLTARGRPQEALDLLSYARYELEGDAQRGHRATARALALRAMNRLDESSRAAEESERLTPRTAAFLKVLGLSSG